MVASRQDAWTEDDDLLLAEVTLRHIREGGTQLAAFEEVGYRLGRTAAACGFRWNSLVRKKYESAIQIAKAQRQQLKSRGRSRMIPDTVPHMSSPSMAQSGMAQSSMTQSSMTQPSMSSIATRLEEYASEPMEYAREQAGQHNEVSGFSTPLSLRHKDNQADAAVNFDDVIRFLRQQKESYRKWRNIDRELSEKNQEIERLREENRRMKKELDSVQGEYQTMNDDYKALIKIMERARKLAFLADEEEEKDKVTFKMDKNGNLERVEKS